jgi:hypothetical protein
MTYHRASLPRIVSKSASLTVLGLAVTFSASQPRGQGATDIQTRVAELKESMAANKAALATYTWEETVKIILKGEEKKTEHFEVRQSPDGKPIKTSLDPALPPQQVSGGRLKKCIVEKKKEEYKDYADNMKELAGHYIPPDKDAIQAAYPKVTSQLFPVAARPARSSWSSTTTTNQEIP